MRLIGWAAVIYTVRDWWSLATFLVLVTLFVYLEERQWKIRGRRKQ